MDKRERDKERSAQQVELGSRDSEKAHNSICLIINGEPHLPNHQWRTP